MIVDAGELADGTPLHAPVCVIGGGPTGISLALRLAELGVDSMVLESGGTEPDEVTQSLYEGESSRYVDLSQTRVRMLGGSTNHWSGQSRPLEPIDFVAQPWRGGEGWPITRDEAFRHLDAATRFLGLAEPNWDHARWFPDDPVPEGEEVVEKVFQRRRLAIGEVYYSALEVSDRVTVVLHANVTQVHVDPVSGAVSSLDVRTLEGTSLTATADEYVLAAGGIESPRLLLASTDVPGGVGNASGLVGRYFSDHHVVGPLPLVPGPRAHEPDVPELPGDELDPDAPVFVTRALAPSPATQERLGILGFHAFLLQAEVPPDEELPVEGIEALINVGGPDPGPVSVVVIGFEQHPNPESRVTLGEGRNALGEPVASVEWLLDEDDERSMQLGVDALARSLARARIGRLRTSPPAGAWHHIVGPQHHHMGTLRMGLSPSDSVLDADLRFHDVPNLSAAGCAVFPTYGHVNPTLNGIALTLRLADHLAEQIGVPAEVRT